MQSSDGPTRLVRNARIVMACWDVEGPTRLVIVHRTHFVLVRLGCQYRVAVFPTARATTDPSPLCTCIPMRPSTRISARDPGHAWWPIHVYIPPNGKKSRLPVLEIKPPQAGERGCKHRVGVTLAHHHRQSLSSRWLYMTYGKTLTAVSTGRYFFTMLW